MTSSTLPPFALPLGQDHTDPEWEFLFPEEAESAAGLNEVTTNPEVADREGYLDRHVADSSRAQLLAYPVPAGQPASGLAVLVCPGGGYRNLAFDKEGTDVARFLNSFGCAAFVLKYPMPGSAEKPGFQPHAPLRAAQRALRLIRARAAEYRVRPDRIGVMGFSAGGHLAATASTCFQENVESDAALAGFSCRPDFSLLIYPVIALHGKMAHLGSARNLLGESPDPELLRRFSPAERVDGTTPSAFLVQTQDDGVSVDNSLLYYTALCRAGVKAEMHLYQEGGHGYGMRRRGLPVDAWPQRLQEWLTRYFA